MHLLTFMGTYSEDSDRQTKDERKLKRQLKEDLINSEF